MSNQQQIKNRLKSIKLTKKITKAMHVVAVSKLQIAKEKAKNNTKYITILNKIMYEINRKNNFTTFSILTPRHFDNSKLKSMYHVLIVITSNKGLCGAFNTNIIKAVTNDINKLKTNGTAIKLLIIGKRGQDILKNKYTKIISKYYDNKSNNNELLSNSIKNKIITMIKNTEIKACDMYYTKFQNSISQTVIKSQILPIQNNNISDNSLKYECEGDQLHYDIINLYIKEQINYGLTQSQTSEEGARMTTMDHATKNAEELIDELSIQLHRSRHANITTELAEIIAGVETL
jgi:F-type H+-transporting ATPase subunit gamma